MDNIKLKFSYSNQRLYTHLVICILGLVLGLSYYFNINATLVFKPFAMTLLGFIYLFIFIYELKQKYFEITKDKIKIKSIFGKEIKIDEITDVIFYEGKYIFKDSNKSLKIIKSSIKKNQIAEFEEFFDDVKNKIAFRKAS